VNGYSGRLFQAGEAATENASSARRPVEVQYGFMSHQTHRSYQRRVFTDQMTQTNSVKALKEENAAKR